MQTFLPIDSFQESALVLDDKRLRNQRNECKVILKTLLGMYPMKNGRPGGWPHHPAVKMWQGYEQSLCRYAIVICETHIAREYSDSLLPFFIEMRNKLPKCGDPLWFGGRIHSSHRSNLLRKNPNWYGQYGWKETPDMDYFWPVN